MVSQAQTSRRAYSPRKSSKQDQTGPYNITKGSQLLYLAQTVNLLGTPIKSTLSLRHLLHRPASSAHFNKPFLLMLGAGGKYLGANQLRHLRDDNELNLLPLANSAHAVCTLTEVNMPLSAKSFRFR
jgi:hypothetical protein